MKCVKHENVIDFYGAFVDSAESRPIPAGKEFGPLDARAQHKEFMDRWETNVNLNGYRSDADSEFSSDGEQKPSSHGKCSKGTRASYASSGSDQGRGHAKAQPQ